MTGAQEEKIGLRIMIAAMAILGLDVVAGVWMLALTHGRIDPPDPPQFLFVGMAIAATLLFVGITLLFHGQSRRFREHG